MSVRRTVEAGRAASARTLGGVLLALLAASCTSLPSEPESRVVVTGSAGFVGARDEATAKAYLEMLERLTPAVRAALVDALARPVRLHVGEHVALTGATRYLGGVTVHTPDAAWISLSTRAASPENVLAHELVHHSLGPSWSTLPPMLEEGLCDVIAEDVSRTSDASERGARLVAVHTWAGGGFELPESLRARLDDGAPAAVRATTRVSWTSMPADLPEPSSLLASEALLPRDEETLNERGFADAIAYVLVRRIGVESLHALCVRAAREGRSRVPPSWILASAGLEDGDARGWREAARALEGPREFDWIVQRLRSERARSEAARVAR